MKALPLLIFSLLAAVAFSQQRVDVSTNYVNVSTGRFFQDAQGVRILANTKYYRPVAGSPFFSDDWMKGSAALTPEREYQNLWLRLDLLSNKLHFRDIKGEEMICTTPVYSLTMKDSATGEVHSFVHSSYLRAAAGLKPQAWLELLVDGKAQLFCHHKKTMTETQPYGSATLEQRFFTFDLFYLVVNGQMQRIKKAKDIVAALPDKKVQLEEWMRRNPGDKGSEYMSDLVAYYNSLVK
jgi:hypothetical protein